ncbi:hypothetical protein [Anaeromicropila herbilytica]|uniref:Uncharacterized protein n=1 Tax=Anaeromicropila herbilytica TaxID=2785025 RepID=A0A7R7EI60_9FIRM|nr:hypothetical protein [Anaeromicropila herbilytica]BCN28892.1 hypothetical protein bsdtb5_01870 [Anaeromicropila herbilytica]
MDKKRKIIQLYQDVITVPEVITRLYTEYQKLGYEMGKKIMFAFWYYRKENIKMLVYWEEGYIYEEMV